MPPNRTAALITWNPENGRDVLHQNGLRNVSMCRTWMMYFDYVKSDDEEFRQLHQIRFHFSGWIHEQRFVYWNDRIKCKRFTEPYILDGYVITSFKTCCRVHFSMISCCISQSNEVSIFTIFTFPSVWRGVSFSRSSTGKYFSGWRSSS